MEQKSNTTNLETTKQKWRKTKATFQKTREHDPEEYITSRDNNIVLESVRQATEIYEPDDTRTNLQYNL